MYKDKISHIAVTMDSHPFQHVATMAAWSFADNTHPVPTSAGFPIVHKGVSDGKVTYTVDGREVTTSIENPVINEGPIYPGGGLVLWPVHCVQGTRGHALHPLISEALVKRKKPYSIFRKGEKAGVEEFSGVVEDAKNNLLDFVQKTKCKNVFLVGEALDFCVLETAKDLVKGGIKVTILTDLCSSVFPGEPKAYKGITYSTTDKLRMVVPNHYSIFPQKREKIDELMTLMKTAQDEIHCEKFPCFLLDSKGKEVPKENPHREYLSDRQFTASAHMISSEPFSREYAQSRLLPTRVSFCRFRTGDTCPAVNPYSSKERKLPDGRGDLPFFGANHVICERWNGRFFLRANATFNTIVFTETPQTTLTLNVLLLTETRENEVGVWETIYTNTRVLAQMYLPHALNMHHAWIEITMVSTTEKPPDLTSIELEDEEVRALLKDNF